jgi:hypothetical protein
MATVYEIIQGINQAAANGSWDGAHSTDLAADGKARSAGLKREDGHFINDRRVMDGFKVSFHGPLLRLKYQSEILVKDVARNGFEDDVIGHLKEIVKFLKKEYKAITGDTLTLTQEGEHKILVQRMSNYRTDCQAQCDYRIGGLTDVVEVNGGSSEERLDSAVRDFLSMGRDKAKKPSNIKV